MIGLLFFNGIVNSLKQTYYVNELWLMIYIRAGYDLSGRDRKNIEDH